MDDGSCRAFFHPDRHPSGAGLLIGVEYDSITHDGERPGRVLAAVADEKSIKFQVQYIAHVCLPSIGVDGWRLESVRSGLVLVRGGF